MLYWAEGAKARNSVRFSNSDPEMLRFFLAFLRRYFSIGDAVVRVTCNLYAEASSDAGGRAPTPS